MASSSQPPPPPPPPDPAIPSQPSDNELAKMLRAHVDHRASAPGNNTITIHDADVYAQDPADLTQQFTPAVAEDDGQKAWYFSTKLQPKSQRRGKRNRRCMESGVWHDEGKSKPVVGSEGQATGHRSLFTFRKKVDGKKGAGTGWIMHEFRLPGNEESPVVLCKVFRSSRWCAPDPAISAAAEAQAQAEVEALAEREAVVEAVRVALARRDAVSERNLQEAEAQAQAQAEVEVEVEEREAEVARREEALPPREEAVARREAEVARREASLPPREEAVARREAEVARREEALPAREAAVEARRDAADLAVLVATSFETNAVVPEYPSLMGRRAGPGVILLVGPGSQGREVARLLDELAARGERLLADLVVMLQARERRTLLSERWTLPWRRTLLWRLEFYEEFDRRLEELEREAEVREAEGEGLARREAARLAAWERDLQERERNLTAREAAENSRRQAIYEELLADVEALVLILMAAIMMAARAGLLLPVAGGSRASVAHCGGALLEPLF